MACEGMVPYSHFIAAITNKQRPKYQLHERLSSHIITPADTLTLRTQYTSVVVDSGKKQGTSMIIRHRVILFVRNKAVLYIHEFLGK